VLQYLEARHRGHARLEDCIRGGKDTGFGRFPSRQYNINTAWLELALTACDMLAWTQLLLLDGELATAEPKRLRYRLLHVAARITRTARRTRLRIAQSWPWAAASPPRSPASPSSHDRQADHAKPATTRPTNQSPETPHRPTPAQTTPTTPIHRPMPTPPASHGKIRSLVNDRG